MKQIFRTSGPCISAVQKPVNEVTEFPQCVEESNIPTAKEDPAAQIAKTQIRLKQGFVYSRPSNIPINKPTHYRNSGNYGNFRNQIRAQLEEERQAKARRQAKAQKQEEARKQAEAQKQAKAKKQAEAQREQQHLTSIRQQADLARPNADLIRPKADAAPQNTALLRQYASLARQYAGLAKQYAQLAGKYSGLEKQSEYRTKQKQYEASSKQYEASAKQYEDSAKHYENLATQEEARQKIAKQEQARLKEEITRQEAAKKQETETPNDTKQHTDERGLITQYKYDPKGNLTEKSTLGDLTGNKENNTLTTKYTYNSDNLLVSAIDLFHNEITNFYEDKENPSFPSRIEYKAQGETLFNIRNTYYASTAENKPSLQKQQITEGNSDKILIENHYNQQGLLTSQKEITGTSDPDLFTQFEYNSGGELTKQIDDTGISLYTHDPEKKQIRIERRDKADNLVTSQTFHYNDNGQPTQIEQLGKDPTTYKHDSSGNLTEINSSKSDLIKMAYNEKGQILSHATYDQNDETKISNEKFTYEPGGNIASYTNPQGEETKYLYTADGKLLQQQNPDGTKQEWSYQLDGRLIKQTLSDGTTWENTYNDTERTATWTKKNAANETLTQETYKFDQRGNITSYTDEKNQTITRQYDKLNRLIAEIRPAETAEVAPRRTDIAYNSNTITITKAEEKHTFTQDALGRITSILVQDANSQKISETTYNYSAGKTTITETKDSVTTTTITDVTNSPLNWTDVAEKLAKGFNNGWNKEASPADSLTYKIGNYAGAFLADASDLFPAVGIIEAITGYRFLGHRLLNPQERIAALSSTAIGILPIALLTRATGGAKVLVGVSVPSSTITNVVTPFEAVGTKIGTLDFTTPIHKAIFYSGPGQRVRAATFAERTGGMTIEMTKGGRALVADPVFQSLSPAEQFKVWQKASISFAQGSSGKVNAFIRGALPERTFRMIEAPILKANSNVYRLIYHY